MLGFSTSEYYYAKKKKSQLWLCTFKDPIQCNSWYGVEVVLLVVLFWMTAQVLAPWTSGFRMVRSWGWGNNCISFTWPLTAWIVWWECLRLAQVLVLFLQRHIAFSLCFFFLRSFIKMNKTEFQMHTCIDNMPIGELCGLFADCALTLKSAVGSDGDF